MSSSTIQVEFYVSWEFNDLEIFLERQGGKIDLMVADIWVFFLAFEKECWLG